jgi:hypothetical protein
LLVSFSRLDSGIYGFFWSTHRYWFATTKVLTRRQARWAEHLAEFNFKVVYRPGDKNTKADVLSRRWDHVPEGGSETAPEVSFFKPGQYVDEESRKDSQPRETRRNTPNMASSSSRTTREKETDVLRGRIPHAAVSLLPQVRR